MKTNKKKLYKDFTWDQHFKNTVNWIEPDTDYKNIIVIKYDPDLNNKIQKLINELGIENKNIPVPITNISVNTHNEHELDDDYVNNFLLEYFKEDYNLIHLIESNPQLFKLVI